MAWRAGPWEAGACWSHQWPQDVHAGFMYATLLFILPPPSSSLLPLFPGILQQPLSCGLDLTPGFHGSGSQGSRKPLEPRRPPRDGPHGPWVPGSELGRSPSCQSCPLPCPGHLVRCGGRLLGPAVFFMTLGDIAQALQFLSQLPLF